MSLGPIRKNRTVWVDLGYFGSSFYLGFVPNEAAWIETFRRLSRAYATYPTAPGMCTSLHDANGKTTALITIADALDKSNGHNVSSVILHECIHVFQRLCEHIGEEGKPSKEFEAYMIQHIYADIAEAYTKTRVELFRRKPC